MAVRIQHHVVQLEIAIDYATAVEVEKTDNDFSSVESASTQMHHNSHVTCTIT